RYADHGDRHSFPTRRSSDLCRVYNRGKYGRYKTNTFKGDKGSFIMNGVINVLKPTGMTSFDVVAYLRRILKIKKVGHTGTLDPCAAGVLPVCLGKATKAVEFLIDNDKIYRAGLKLGNSTDT